MLEMAERVLNNLQKGIVDNIISTAAGLEKGAHILLLMRLCRTMNLHHIYQDILTKIL